MLNKAITDAEKRIKEILSARETELNDINIQITEEEKILKGHEAAMDKAKKAGKTKEYREALNKSRECQDTINMYRERLKELEEQALITPGEYESLTGNIKASFTIAEDEAFEKLYKLSNEMKKISDDMSELLTASNKTLLILQRDINRNADRKRNIYGYICDSPISISKNAAIYWGNAPTLLHPYIEYSKTKGGR